MIDSKFAEATAATVVPLSPYELDLVLKMMEAEEGRQFLKMRTVLLFIVPSVICYRSPTE